jgi:hypothetical protein
MTPPDGVLRRVADRTWEARLHGYRVLLFYSGDSWHFCIVHPKGYVEACPRVLSFVEGARRAREWIEGTAAGR